MKFSKDADVTYPTKETFAKAHPHIAPEKVTEFWDKYLKEKADKKAPVKGESL